MLFSASGAVTLPSVLVAQAGQLIASADAIAVTRLGSRFDRNQSHRHHHPFAAMLPKIPRADKGPNRASRTHLAELGPSDFARPDILPSVTNDSELGARRNFHCQPDGWPDVMSNHGVYAPSRQGCVWGL